MAETRIQWELNRDSGCIQEQETEEVMMYLDQIPQDIAVMVINMWNDGQTVQQIGKELDKIEGLSLDDSDHIIEQINQYIKVTEKENPADAVWNHQDEVRSAATEKAIEDSGMTGMFKTADQWKEELNKSTENMDTGVVTSTVDNIVPTGNGSGSITSNSVSAGNGIITDTYIIPADTKPGTVIEPVTGPPAKTLKRNRTSPPQGKGSAATLIASMQAQQEKIKRIMDCVAWIDDSVNTQDIPEGLLKPERDTLLAYAKALESVQSEYLIKIQSV